MSREDALLVDDAFGQLQEPRRHAERLLGLLDAQRGQAPNVVVDLHEHGVQMATRMLRIGASEELVVAALLHDIGELMVPNAHGEVVASILRPYVTPRTTWLLAHHEVFQFYHYGHAWGADPVEKDLPRQMFASHPHFNATVNFCEVDQAAFDPDYPSLPSEFFLPMVERVLRRTPYWWARVTAHADEVDDTVRAKMALQAAYPGSALLPLHQPRPTAEPWSAAKGFVPRRFALSAIGGAGGEPAQLRALFEAYFEHGIVIVEGLASHDEAAWAQDVRGVVRALLPRGAADISDEPFWNSGTALRATYNDYVTNDVHRRAAAESDSNVSHAGWAGNVPMLLHHDGCFLAEAVRTKVYAAWGPSTMSNFMDGAAELAALDDDARFSLRVTPVVTSYEGKWEAARPVLSPDNVLCWNEHDRVAEAEAEAEAEVCAGGDATAGRDALAALAERFHTTSPLRVPSEKGVAVIVDNWRVLHGRDAVPPGRRRLMGGEIPSPDVDARWAELAAV